VLQLSQSPSLPCVQARQPTYINPAPAPTPVDPIFTSQPLSPEEVCMEGAMRDQDMADMDVTSPGIWVHESDVHYAGVSPRPNELSKPYMPSMNPRCPTPKRQLAHASYNVALKNSTVSTYHQQHQRSVTCRSHCPLHAIHTVHCMPLMLSIELKSPKVCAPLLQLCSPYAIVAS
jgi:hypothetical protein